MQAAFFVAPRRIEIRDIPQPMTPHDGLKLRVRACAICGSDVRRWREGPQPDADAIIPGHEIAGEVVEIGKDVAHYRVGDRLAIGPDVHCDHCFYCRRGQYNLCDHIVLYGITPGHHGGFAEYMIVPNEILSRGIIHAIPDGLSYQAAALSESCSSVIACHRVNCTTLGDTIVVLGAGPIGCLHAVVARAHGARVLISEPNEKRRKMVEQFAPTAIIDPGHDDLPAIVKKYSDGIGADMVICANPVVSTQEQAVQIVRKGGVVILFGGLPRAHPMTTLDGNRIHYGQIQVIGSFSYHPTHHALALRYLQEGIIPAEKLITAEFSLPDVQRAYEIADKGEALKIIINV